MNKDNINLKTSFGEIGKNLNESESNDNYMESKEKDSKIISKKNNKKFKFSDLIRSCNSNSYPENLSFPSIDGATSSTSQVQPDMVTGSGNGGIIYNKSYKQASATNGPSPLEDVAINSYLDSKNPKDYGDNVSFMSQLANKYNNSPYNLNLLSKQFISEGYTPSIGYHTLLGLLAGLVGGGLKHGVSAVMQTPNQNSLTTDLLLGSGIGAAGGGLYGAAKHKDYLINKYGSIKKVAFPTFISNGFGNTYATSLGDMTSFIGNKILTDNSLNINQKNDLITYVNNQPNDVLEGIYKIVKTSMGAGIGYLISSYLLGLGKRGQIILSLAGGLIANNYFDNSAQMFNPIKDFNYNTY